MVTAKAEPAAASSRWGVLRVVHPFPSVLAAAVTVVLVSFADPAAPVALYLALSLAMLP